MKLHTEITEFCIGGLEGTRWDFRSNCQAIAEGLWQLDISLSAPEAIALPELTIDWNLPLLDTINCWTTAHKGGAELPADWCSSQVFSIADEIPEMVFHNREGLCTAAAAFSDAMRVVEFHGGICEPDCSLHFILKLFRRKEAARQGWSGSIRLDLRRKFFADTVRGFAAWYESFPEYRAMPAPEAAREPLYSTWYSYHHDVHDFSVRAECEEAARLGMKTVIVDSGWDNDDNTLGPIACGRWRPSARRFPDFAAHVREVQALGLKYMLWFAVPFIGRQSGMYEQFRGCFLFEQSNAGVLDPRFPGVREYVIGCCRRLICDYGIDGLKLDFINTFTECTEDPALADGMGSRDIPTIPETVDRLMMDISAAIRAYRPDALIEFRQCYVGPAIRKYGNMLRAADCPADQEGNRRRTINLRLTSGSTAVHSDMLEWRTDYQVQNAALQLLCVMFSVPQISVRLRELPDDHRRMLDFLLKFFIRHRRLLLESSLTPCYPDHNYPVVYAFSERERIAAAYGGGFVVHFAPGNFSGTTYVVNATGGDEVIADLQLAPGTTAWLRNCQGETLPFDLPQSGLSRLAMPSASILKLSPPQN